MPTNPKKSAVNSLKNVGLLPIITPEVVDYLSANNEAIAHALRYIIPINGNNNPKREHIAITLADQKFSTFLRKDNFNRSFVNRAIKTHICTQVYLKLVGKGSNNILYSAKKLQKSSKLSDFCFLT